MFIAAICVGCLFGKLISNNKVRFSSVYLQFIALLQPTVLSASLNPKMSYTTDGANISIDISDAVDFFRTSFFLSCIFVCIYGLVALLIAQRALTPLRIGFLLLVCYCFNFSKIKRLDE
jgi:ABC-type branched-subunit amino acid transport system permease subunit